MNGWMRASIGACVALCSSASLQAQPAPGYYYPQPPFFFAPYAPYAPYAPFGYQQPPGYPAVAQPVAPASAPVPTPIPAATATPAPAQSTTRSPEVVAATAGARAEQSSTGTTSVSVSTADIATIDDSFRIEQARFGSVLADAEGRTLYSSTLDASGNLACRNGCVGLWRAALIGGPQEPAAPFGALKRDDGSRQWTCQGRPLYQWVGDEQAGDATGERIDGTWFAVRVRGG